MCHRLLKIVVFIVLWNGLTQQKNERQQQLHQIIRYGKHSTRSSSSEKKIFYTFCEIEKEEKRGREADDIQNDDLFSI